MRPWVLTVVVMGAGCATRTAPELSWRFEARATYGEVQVVPMIELQDDPELDLHVYVNEELRLPYGERYDLRRHRTKQLSEFPFHVALSLPGAVNGELGKDWKGQFRSAKYPLGGQRKLKAALEGRADLDQTLSEVAHGMSGQATLFTWVQDLDGRPISRDGAPGWVVETEWGPVVVAYSEEPYLVTMQVGMALVTRDGEVVLRYEDQYSTVLSNHQDPEAAGSDLARSMAEEVTKLWACDPEFDDSELLAKKPK